MAGFLLVVELHIVCSASIKISSLWWVELDWVVNKVINCFVIFGCLMLSWPVGLKLIQLMGQFVHSVIILWFLAIIWLWFLEEQLRNLICGISKLLEFNLDHINCLKIKFALIACKEFLRIKKILMLFLKQSSFPLDFSIQFHSKSNIHFKPLAFYMIVLHTSRLLPLE